VVVARISEVLAKSDGHRGGRNIKLTLTGEVRTYPGYNAQMGDRRSASVAHGLG